MLQRLVARWTETSPWTDVYGLCRTLLAVGTLSTLIATPTDALFHPVVGRPRVPGCEGISSFGFFCQCSAEGGLFPWIGLSGGKWIAILLLLVVASGWRPRFSGLIHWWMSFSLQVNASMLDGGDSVTAVLTLLLLPVTLTDARRWHWSPPRSSGADSISFWEEIRRIGAWSTFWIIRLQVAGIYFHSAVDKFTVEEWVNGTALYYWFTDPYFGIPGWLFPFVVPVIKSELLLPVATWSVMLFELLLFAGLIASPKHRRRLLIAGILFHAAIGLFMGLISFMFAMWAALILFLRPPSRRFRLGDRLSSLGTVAATNPVGKIKRALNDQLEPSTPSSGT